jgi:hypothetical protein
VHKIVRTVANQAEYPSLNIRPSRGAADSDNFMEWNFVPEVLKLIFFAAGSGRIPNPIIATLLRPMLQQQLHFRRYPFLNDQSGHRSVVSAQRTGTRTLLERSLPE